MRQPPNMPSFNVFGGVTGRNSATLFEIRFVVLLRRLTTLLIISQP